MNYDLRWVLVLLANLLLILLAGEVNHYLSPLALHIYLGGLLLTFGMLRLQLRQGFLANGITALVLDALNPLDFGFTFLLIMTCHTAIFSIRGQFDRESLRSNLLIALALNLVLMIALGLASSGNATNTSVLWSRIVADSALSTVAVLLVGPWFFALQKSSLAFIGIDLDAEQREAQ